MIGALLETKGDLMKKIAKQVVIIFALIFHIGSAQAQPPKAEGVPIKIGDTLETVQKAYETTRGPEPYMVGTKNAGTQLHLASNGVLVVFDEQGKVKTIRLEAPFSGNIGGVKIGSSQSQIEKLLGPPDKRSYPPLVATESHDYYFEDIATTRLAFGPGAKVQAIILYKSKGLKNPKNQVESVAQSDEDIKGFSDNLTRTIRAAMDEWKQRYVCGRAITVRPFKGESKSMGNGEKETVEESAGPGWINIDPDTQLSIRNTVLHAMTHACPQNEPTMLLQPVPFHDGLIIGYHGAAIIVKLKNHKQTFFRKLEEGLCERNASFFPGYSISNKHYFSVGKLARQHFPQGQDTMSLIRNNNVPGLISIILNRPIQSLSDDIEKVMSLYQKAWSGGLEAKQEQGK
jgi:hypothetical protein